MCLLIGTLSNFWDETVRGGVAADGVFMGFVAEFQRVSFGPGLWAWRAGAARRNMSVFALFADSCHKILRYSALL